MVLYAFCSFTCAIIQVASFQDDQYNQAVKRVLPFCVFVCGLNVCVFVSGNCFFVVVCFVLFCFFLFLYLVLFLFLFCWLRGLNNKDNDYSSWLIQNIFVFGLAGLLLQRTNNNLRDSKFKFWMGWNNTNNCERSDCYSGYPMWRLATRHGNQIWVERISVWTVEMRPL